MMDCCGIVVDAEILHEDSYRSVWLVPWAKDPNDDRTNEHHAVLLLIGRTMDQANDSSRVVAKCRPIQRRLRSTLGDCPE